MKVLATAVLLLSAVLIAHGEGDGDLNNDKGNLERKAQFDQFNNFNGGSYGGGSSSSMSSGTDEYGYQYMIEEKVSGNFKYHTERRYNPYTNMMDEATYTLNLNDPYAYPIWNNRSMPLDQ